MENNSYNYLFVSDLHLSAGRSPATGKWSRTEDFFFDDAFARCLTYHIALTQDNAAPPHFQDKGWRLVINGDIFDFLQVMELPAEDEVEEWMAQREGKPFSAQEKRYGLGTRQEEIVWKLERIAAGHPLFFEALGWFLAHEGCQLIVLKGNHDVELHWNQAQRRMQDLISCAYQKWYARQEEGVMPESPLPYSSQLPASLSANVLKNIQFPAWFYYEPGLFYVEHGNQYDPANAFIEFLEPILPDAPDLIELPSGSFFVRYFFNKIEQIHPFADNMKPIARYVRWAINEQPIDTIKMLINQWDIIWRSAWNLLKKKADPIRGRPDLLKKKPKPKDAGKVGVPLNPYRWSQLYEIRDHFQQLASKLGARTSYFSLGLVGLAAAHGLGIMFSIRSFVQSKWRDLAISLVAAGSAFTGKTLLNAQLNQFDTLVTLQDVAEKICRALNQPDEKGDKAAVRFFIFGHNHDPKVFPLNDDSGNAPDYPQWYVNTGSWLPSFTEHDQLMRGHIQLTFFRLVPDEPNFGETLPTLWEWLPEADRPRRLVMFE